MKAPVCIQVDFETEGIQSRPEYPPVPVGCAITYPGKKGKYLAWGHPEENNVDKAQAFKEIKDVFNSNQNLLFQNGKFDVDVATTHIPGVKMPSWNRVHDSMFQIFLHDPYANTFSLKPSAERILGILPGERDEVENWVLENIKGSTKKNWGAYICKAPGGLVGKYAIGDNLRTGKLHNYLWPKLYDRGMNQAYDRERKIMPIMLRNEQEGMRVDLPGLERDFEIYSKALKKADQWLRKRLKAPGLNIDADAEFAKALSASGVVLAFVKTVTGKDSVSKKNLTIDMFSDQKVFAVFNYRNKLSTCLGTFMEPWLRQAQLTGGRIHTSWNQVKSEGGGAASGRFSSTPNFQNIPKEFKKISDAIEAFLLSILPPLPRMRTYCIPDEDGDVWIRRDCNQQELRLVAHYEDGSLCAAYNENPRYDVHKLVQDGIKKITGIELDRPATKVVNFQDIYGGGIPALMLGINCTAAQAREIKQAKRALMPDFEELNNRVKQIGRSGEPIVTFGGREYFVEPPSYSKKQNRMMTWEYKLLNYLIQGSAADMAKEIIIRYDEHPKRKASLRVCVHDEFNSSTTKGQVKPEMKVLKEVIESIELDVPVISDGEIGPNWGALKAYNDELGKVAA